VLPKRHTGINKGGFYFYSMLVSVLLLKGDAKSFLVLVHGSYVSTLMDAPCVIVQSHVVIIPGYCFIISYTARILVALFVFL
jgi:hypothetical protein